MIAKQRIPKVRMAKPKGRPIQLRDTCPVENREVRVSTGTHDEREALEQRRELEAQLVLGIATKRRKVQAGPQTPWADFRDQFTELHLTTLRDGSAADSESRLDIAEKILKPRTLADVANSDALHTLQTRLLAGAHSR